MAMEGKEGESYLDQLLNTVAPDWEDTSSTPDSSVPETAEDISLNDALAILNDLPEAEEVTDVPEDIGEDMEELFGLLADLPANPTEEENETFEEEIPEIEILPEPEEFVEDEAVEAEGVEEEESVTGLEDIMDLIPEEDPEELLGEEPEVVEMTEELPADEENAEDMEEAVVSSDSINVDDIFQDALSAVEYSENEDEMPDTEDSGDIFSLDEFMEDDPMAGVSSIPVTDLSDKTDSEKAPKENFFKKIFGNIVTEQTAEEEENERQAELEAKEKKAAEREEKRKQAELDKEEKEKLSQEAKEHKKILKAEKAREKAEKREEKKRRKKELAEEEAQEVVGKLNPIGTTIVVIFFATIGVFTIFGSQLLNRASSLSEAENYYANGEFIRAYDEISGVELKEDDQELYDRIRMCSQMQKELNSYGNYTKMEMHLEALDSLMKGIRYYDIHKGQAEALGAMSALNGLESQLAASLYNDFGLSETQAREILTLEDQAEYTKRLEEIVRRVQAATYEE